MKKFDKKMVTWIIIGAIIGAIVSSVRIETIKVNWSWSEPVMTDREIVDSLKPEDFTEYYDGQIRVAWDHPSKDGDGYIYGFSKLKYPNDWNDGIWASKEYWKSLISNNKKNIYFGEEDYNE